MISVEAAGPRALPAPMTPADCDLRGLAFMPIDVIRLLDSDLFALATGDEFKAAFALWGKSWMQVPGGSLPVDARVLAHLSGHRSGPWSDVCDMALRGWVECSDGRLYHPVVAEKAIEAWEKRGKWRERETTKAERQQRWREKLRILSKRLRDKGVQIPEHPKAKELETLCRQHNVDSNVDVETSTVDAQTTAMTGDRGQGKGTLNIVTPIGVGAAKRGTRLPDDFAMPGDWIALAVEKGLPQEAALREADKFTNYWQAKSGRDATKIDWRKTWANWVLSADKARGRNFNGAGREYLGV